VLRRYRIANVPEDARLREELMAMDQTELAEKLMRLDPDLAERTDRSSKKRIVRALEVAEWGLRQPVEHSRLPERPLDFEVWCLDVERAALRSRIDRRLDLRLEAGMVEEVQGLLEKGIATDRLKALGMEYREIAAYLSGEKTRDRMVEDLRHEIHLLAKRQETWFRGMEKRGVPMRHLAGTLEEMAETILSTWRKE
jgi:tRNA dimethylallyltransferase